MTALLDNFQGANGTALAAHTPDVGGTWVSDTPGWAIEGNTLQQLVDNPDAHILVAGSKIRQARVVFDLNGMDNTNNLFVTLDDGSANNEIYFSINGQGYLEPVCRASGSQVFDLNFNDPWVNPVGVHEVVLTLGPSLSTMTLDGARVFTTLRKIAMSTKFTRFHITSGALAAHPSPKLKQVFVS